jgi:hypothetical protein
MSVSAAFPSPGSGAPGAPPPLKRALTPADGVPATPREQAEPSAAPQPVTAHSAGAPTHLTVAAAMAGVAFGLELARLIGRRRPRHRTNTLEVLKCRS